MTNIATCELCGEVMPRGEEMFTRHGYSGNCPKPPLEKQEVDPLELARLRGYEQGVEQMRKDASERKVEVTDEMVETYCSAVAKHLGAMSHDEWERDRADPVTHAHRVARVGLTAVLSELNLPVGGDA